MTPSDALCSFCQKSYRDVGPLVEGADNLYICGQCAELCQTIVEQERRRRSVSPPSSGAAPSLADVIEGLDRCINGLAEAKSIIAGVVHRHYQTAGGERKDHNHLLVIGSRSSGLLLARALAHLFHVPVAHGDARSIHAIAEISQPPESIYFQLLQSAEFDLEASQRGIVYLYGIHDSSVWTGIIDALQRRVVNAFPNGPEVQTRNILFICSGQFDTPNKFGDGISSNRDTAISLDDLISLGIDRKLATLFGAAVRLPRLDDETLIRVVSSADIASLCQGGVE